MKSVDLLFDYLTPSLPRRWRHFCVIYKEQGQSASVFQVADGDDNKDNDSEDFYHSALYSGHILDDEDKDDDKDIDKDDAKYNDQNDNKDEKK